MNKALISTMSLSLLLGLGCASSGKTTKDGDDGKAAAKPTKEMSPTGSMIVKYAVSDFDKWKASFDEHADPRKGMGVVWHSVSRGSDDQNVVITHFVGKDLAKMQAFTASPGWKKAMESSGVTGDATLWFANDVQIDSPRGKVEKATVSMIVKHEVDDFDAWKAAYDGAKEGRANSGMIGGSVSRHIDNPNVVIVHMMGSDLEAMKAYAGSDRFKQAMEQSGVKGEPEIWFATDVDVKQY